MFLSDVAQLERMIQATGGKPVAWGERQSWAHKDAATADVLADLGTAAKGVKHTLTYPTEAFPGLRQREILDVDGEEFEVREINQVDDGAMSVALLATPRAG